MVLLGMDRKVVILTLNAVKGKDLLFFSPGRNQDQSGEKQPN
jgi:hypothetical protein